MGANQAIDHLDNSDAKAKDALTDSNSKSPFNAGDLWMSLAHGKKGSDNQAQLLPNLPEIDLKSSKDDDHGGSNSLADNLVDDINTVLHNIDNGKLNVIKNQKAQLSNSADTQDLPVVNCKDMSPGQIGLLMNKNADGNTYYTPFIAGDNAKASSGAPISINENAAKLLHIDGDLSNGKTAKLDVIALPGDASLPPFSPHNPGELNQVVLDKIHDMAEGVRDKQAAQRSQTDATQPEPPPPDKDFGYRRTDRSADELTKIADHYRGLAREYQKNEDPNGIDDRIKDFAKNAQSDIAKYQKEVSQHQQEQKSFEKEEQALKQQEKKLHKKDTEQKKELDAKIQVADDNAKKVGAVLQGSQYNLSYAQSELNISKDKGAYTRHMEARASAAATLSFNPDMDGALDGHRIVINSGHYPGDPKFPGFSKDDTAEWKLNLESEDVVGSMIKMTGGAVKLVNQIDLKSKGMTGLTNAIREAKPEAAIAIHHDDDDPADSPNMRGTLTLECAKTTGKWSMDLAQAVHEAKLNYAGLDDRVNPKGDSVGIREQCGRGIQGHNVGAPFILDEQLSTHKDEWPLARNPKVNAEIQFAHVTALYEFFNHKPQYKTSADEAKQWKDEIWSKTGMDDIWFNRPKVGAW